MDNNPAGSLHFSHMHLSGYRLQKPRACIVAELHLSSGQHHVLIRARIMSRISCRLIHRTREDEDDGSGKDAMKKHRELAMKESITSASAPAAWRRPSGTIIMSHLVDSM